MIITPGFVELLVGFDLTALEAETSVVFGLSADFAIAYVNPAWDRFAEANGGTGALRGAGLLGKPLGDALSNSVRTFFCEHYRLALREGRPWEHLFECSSPEQYREFLLTAFPLVDQKGLLVVSSLRVEVPHDRTKCAPIAALYRDERQVFHQCAHCRRMRRNDAAQSWDWVPAWVASPPPHTSHGLCSACTGFYYADSVLEAGDFPEPLRTSAVARKIASAAG